MSAGRIRHVTTMEQHSCTAAVVVVVVVVVHGFAVLPLGIDCDHQFASFPHVDSQDAWVDCRHHLRMKQPYKSIAVAVVVGIVVAVEIRLQISACDRMEFYSCNGHQSDASYCFLVGCYRYSTDFDRSRIALQLASLSPVAF